jgi:hypothetical protein
MRSATNRWSAGHPERCTPRRPFDGALFKRSENWAFISPFAWIARRYDSRQRIVVGPYQSSLNPEYLTVRLERHDACLLQCTTQTFLGLADRAPTGTATDHTKAALRAEIER